MVHKKMIPNMNGLGFFSLDEAKKKSEKIYSQWPPQKNLIFQLRLLVLPISVPILLDSTRSTEILS